LADLEKQQILLKDLGLWLKRQFCRRPQRTEKDKIYAALNWQEIVISALKLGGFNNFAEAQKLIDKHA